MTRTVLLAAALAACLLVSCSSFADVLDRWASGPSPYGCGKLSDLRAVEARVEEFRSRRDRKLISYDQARSDVVDSFAVQNSHFDRGTCVKLKPGEPLKLVGNAKLRPDDWAKHAWRVSRKKDAVLLWVHTENNATSPPDD